MKSGVTNQNKRASLMLLLKEASNKDTKLETPLLLSFKDDESKGSSENIWLEPEYFGDQRAGLTIQKANFPENTLIYIKQASVSLVQGGEKTIYCDYVVIAQIMPMANIEPAINLDTYSVKENEVLVYCPVYNTRTGMCRGITKTLGLITLRDDAGERFFSYGFNKEKTSLSYCYMKSPLPNIFRCTAFKKHINLLVDQYENKVPSSGMFMFLPATLDRKEDFLKRKDNVHLHPVDLSVTNLPKINPMLLM